MTIASFLSVISRFLHEGEGELKEKHGLACKQEPWNSFGHLANLAKKKEPVIIHLSSNTPGDEIQPREIIIDVENRTLAFPATDRDTFSFLSIR